MLFAAVESSIAVPPWAPSGDAPYHGEPSTGESCVELVNAALTRYCEGKQLTPFSGFTTVTLLPPPLNGQADEGGFRMESAGALCYATDAPISFAAAHSAAGTPVAVVHCGESIGNVSEIRELYGLPVHADLRKDSSAQLLLDLYQKDFADAYGDDSDQPSTVMACLQGSFCFMLLDADRGYMLAARAGSESPPLYWGTSSTGALVFACDPDALAPLVTQPKGGPALFPADCYYESSTHADKGHVVGFTRRINRRELQPVSRVNSHGQLCGLGFHTQSGTDLSAMSVSSMLYPSVGWTK